MRWQEVFGGADSRLIANKQFVDDTTTLRKMYWSETPDQRRKILMPFLWNTIATEGQLYENRNVGNKVNTKNKMWFSYPGYNEILTGFADDEHITSNDLNNNPNKNVLEFINDANGYNGKVAAFLGNFPEDNQYTAQWHVRECRVDEIGSQSECQRDFT